MQLSRYSSLFSIITLLTFSLPAQALCGPEKQSKLESTLDTELPQRTTKYEQKVTSGSLQELDHYELKPTQPKTKPLSTLYLDNEIQRTKPLPQKYQTYGENFHLLNYQQQVRNAQIKKNAQ